MKIYKLFLASSEELAQERKEIALMISRLNNKWTEEKDIHIKLVAWEDLLHSFQKEGKRIQDYFNEEMVKCDIVLALFFKKVGQFTKEEFEFAYANLKKCQKPEFLFVYFKSGTLTIDDVTPDLLKISELKKQIQEYKQIYNSFSSIEDLILKLQHQLELVVKKKPETEVIKTEADKHAKAQSDFEHYKQHMGEKFRYLDFTGLNAILQKPLELEHIYVTLRAKASIASERYRSIADFNRLKREEEDTPKEEDIDFVSLFQEMHQEKKKQQPLRMLILGQPGSGKTTLMKWITLQCLNPDKKAFFAQFTPVFIPLKDFGRDPDNTFRKKNIGNLIIEMLARENSAVDSFLDEHIKANRALFLLDGLDEIGDETIRREVIEWIQKQFIFQNSLIVTSRFSGLNPAEGLTFKDEIPVFEIQDFELKDIDSFLQNWYRNVEIAVGGERDMQKAIETGQKKYEELVADIENEGHRNLRELAVNPLLLTIIAIVHRTRAKLPEERYKLYEECLKVMIELWNLANRKVNVSFSFDNSISYLSEIAVELMKTERREMDKNEIESLLPEKIEGQTRNFFLKEMVLKAGLLYESEGKYGFLHLTFQEYLAARYFAKSKNQNDILGFYDKDYWRETFKLFINIGNAEIFFEEVGEKLVEKNYWKSIELFEACLEEIVTEKTKETVELNFAKKIIQILLGLDYKEENELQIGMLTYFYPLYKNSKKLVKEGWEMFFFAPHPIVQSVGTSILSRADENTRVELLSHLRQRIQKFENLTDESSASLLYFLFQNDNNFVLQIAGRQNLMDFVFALKKLKSEKLFLQYLLLLALRSLQPIGNLLGFLDQWEILGLLNLQGIEGLGYLNLWDIRDLPDLIFLRDFRAIMDIKVIRGIHDDYINKYKPIFENHQKEIYAWADQAIEELHGLSGKKLLEYFPNTTKDELKEFRESYMEIIATELSKGNCTVLEGKKLTKKRQKRVEESVTFDMKTVEKMLDFVLDSSNDEKQALQLKALEILRNKDYEKVYTIIRTIIATHAAMKIRINALYILKRLL